VGARRGPVRLDLAVTDGETSAPAAAPYRTLGFAETGERELMESNPSLSAYFMSRTI
jgi:hypothetical protein